MASAEERKQDILKVLREERPTGSADLTSMNPRPTKARQSKTVPELVQYSPNIAPNISAAEIGSDFGDGGDHGHAIARRVDVLSGIHSSGAQ